MACSQCGKCCQGVILPFIAKGLYGDYLKARGAVEIDKVGTWLPAKCRHLILMKGKGKKLDGTKTPAIYKCDIYDERPYLCHAEHTTSNIEQYRPEGCTNEI